MLRRSLLALAVSLLAVFSLGASIAVASQTEPVAGTSVAETSPGANASYADAELVAALSVSDLVGDWVAASPVSEQASLIEVVPSGEYTQARNDFLLALDVLGARHEHVVARTERGALVNENVDILETLIRHVRRALATSDRSPALSLSEADVSQARIALAQIEGDPHWLGFSLDPLLMAEYRLAEARDEVADEIDVITSSLGGTDSKTHGRLIIRLSEMQHALGNVRELVQLGQDRGQQSRVELAALRAAAIADIPALHAMRTLAATSVAGLPLVTVDAYIQGAATLDDSCPVDWTLLAGIGRIESRHGTLNDAWVQTSGRITESIYGPLLDGGATAREAEEALLAAEEEALLAEQEAAEAERIAAEEEFESSVWGQLKREEEAAGLRPDADGQQGGASQSRESDSEEEAEPPLHDPALWGELPPLDTDDRDNENGPDGEEDEGDDDGDDEEREFKGNGFAVIADSDNGRLDGNPRWDRAVGPMQFIPETWSYWETDGNGDGVSDPQNLYDSAASAGRFLCHLSRTRGSSPWTFVLGYNSSETYVRNVMSAAEALRIAELPAVLATST